MSLQGVLADFPVADVFQLIAQQRKTGVLEVERKGRTLLVFFLEGQVLSARPSETRPDGSLAGYLLRTGALQESALGAGLTALNAPGILPVPWDLGTLGYALPVVIGLACLLPALALGLMQSVSKLGQLRRPE